MRNQPRAARANACNRPTDTPSRPTPPTVRTKVATCPTGPRPGAGPDPADRPVDHPTPAPARRLPGTVTPP
ncbi:MAG: hypothetical protein EA388_08055 [Nitriliruptor sp.]|nr:MAG: hypothetical protein EA388_08055 [Nitriliruptor sp.]